MSIPAIGVTVNLGTLGIQSDRTVQVPQNPERAGWYRFGPSPGQVGSAVILGHVDSTAGPAVFYRLSSLRTGDQVDVINFRGHHLRFRIVKVATYAHADFPAALVYGDHGTRALNLVTCGGGYSHVTGYRGNVVAFTRLVG